MSRKFVGKLIRIMMTKSSSCDILKKKRTIRRGSGSRPKGPYLMDLRFWNYVIPDGSTTIVHARLTQIMFWNYVIPDGSTTSTNQKGKLKCFGTMSFQMVLLRIVISATLARCFGTMSFQMVLLLNAESTANPPRFGTMSFQMVLLREKAAIERLFSFGTMSFQMVLLQFCRRSRCQFRFGTMSFQMVLLHDGTPTWAPFVLELCHSRWFYYLRQIA